MTSEEVYEKKVMPWQLAMLLKEDSFPLSSHNCGLLTYQLGKLVKRKHRLLAEVEIREIEGARRVILRLTKMLESVDRMARMKGAIDGEDPGDLIAGVLRLHGWSGARQLDLKEASDDE